MQIIISSVILLAVIGFVAGAFLAFASKKFEVKENVRFLLVQSALPGVNCGACGFPGCAGFAKAIVDGIAKNDGCLPGKKGGVPEKLTAISKKSDEELEKLFEESESNIDKVKELIF